MTDPRILSQLQQQLRSHLRSTPSPANRAYTPAAVLLAVVLNDAAPHLIFTHRTMTVATHKGQIAFPGGVMEPTDATVDDAALREAHEEIGLSPHNVTVVGYLDGLPTITDFWITPVVGVVHGPFPYVPAEAEVAAVFEVPLAHLLQKNHWSFEERIYRGVRYDDCRFQYGDHIVWGATGKLTWDLVERLQGHL